VKGTAAPDFKGCRDKQKTFDGLDVIARPESRACLFEAVSSTGLLRGPGETRGNRVPAETLLAVSKHVLWLERDSWPGDTGRPGDIFRELRRVDKLCQSNKCVAQAEPRIAPVFS